MICIKKITDEDFGLKSVKFNNPRTRKGARGIVKRNDGKIALLFKSNMNEYKLPGGGIDENEDPKDAFKREVLEETGCIVTIEKELGTIIENKSLDNFTQTSYLYVGRVTEDKKRLNLTKREKEEGAQLIWVIPNKALELIKKSMNNIQESKYENVYHSRFIILRDQTILEYYLKEK